MSSDQSGEGSIHYERATVYFEARDSDPDLWAEEYEGEVVVHPSGFVDCVDIDQLIPSHHINTINYEADRRRRIRDSHVKESEA